MKADDTTKYLDIQIRRREKLDSEVACSVHKVAPENVGILVIDMWNYHWCTTCSMRSAALIPRMNRCLEIARKLGVSIVFAPSDVAGTYAGTPQREIMVSLPHHEIPKEFCYESPNPPDLGVNMCGGDFQCVTNWGHNAMHPDLLIGPEDFICGNHQELYNLCKSNDITNLIYTGVCANICVINKDIGMKTMGKLGLNCIIARDLTDAYSHNSGGNSLDRNTEMVVAYIEKELGSSINLGDELCRNGYWQGNADIDPVLIAPWGTKDRAQFFEENIIISLTSPRTDHDDIRYSIDGSIPEEDSSIYEEPITIDHSTVIRAAAFSRRQKVGLENESYYVKLNKKPPKPDICISDIEPLEASVPGYTYWSPCIPQRIAEINTSGALPPQKDKSYAQTELSIRGIKYKKGVGVHAPARLLYELKGEYLSFVGLAGIDDYLLQKQFGRVLACYPSVIFKVFIDGKCHAESPMMRISQEPWRFNVAIPKGSKIISLVVTDGGDGNREDLANWVNAGFLL